MAELKSTTVNGDVSATGNVTGANITSMQNQINELNSNLDSVVAQISNFRFTGGDIAHGTNKTHTLDLTSKQCDTINCFIIVAVNWSASPTLQCALIYNSADSYWKVTHLAGSGITVRNGVVSISDADWYRCYRF